MGVVFGIRLTASPDVQYSRQRKANGRTGGKTCGMSSGMLRNLDWPASVLASLGREERIKREGNYVRVLNDERVHTARVARGKVDGHGTTDTLSVRDKHALS